MTFQSLCPIGNSQTCTMYNGERHVILSFVPLILLSFWDIPSLVSDKFVTRVKILLVKDILHF